MEGKGGHRSHHIGPCTISCASEWPDGCQLGSLARASPASLPPPSKPSALSSSPTNSWPPREAKSKPSGRRPPPSAVQHSLTFLHPNQLAAPFELSLSASCLPTSLDCQFHARRLDQVPSLYPSVSFVGKQLPIVVAERRLKVNSVADRLFSPTFPDHDNHTRARRLSPCRPWNHHQNEGGWPPRSPTSLPSPRRPRQLSLRSR